MAPTIRKDGPAIGEQNYPALPTFQTQNFTPLFLFRLFWFFIGYGPRLLTNFKRIQYDLAKSILSLSHDTSRTVLVSLIRVCSLKDLYIEILYAFL